MKECAFCITANCNNKIMLPGMDAERKLALRLSQLLAVPAALPLWPGDTLCW